jgi:Domain of unknown function (DUF4136)
MNGGLLARIRGAFVQKGIAMKLMKRLTFIPVILIMLVSAYAQDVHYNYELGANFAKYKTYQWVEPPGGAFVDQLIDQAIKRTVDEQLEQKGLARVEKDGDLRIGYLAVVEDGMSIAFLGTESLHWGWGDGFVQGETSTISVGMVWIDLYDPARKRLVWRGDASKTIDLGKSPQKNYRNLQKTMGKLFRNYPPPPNQG